MDLDAAAATDTAAATDADAQCVHALRVVLLPQIDN